MVKLVQKEETTRYSVINGEFLDILASAILNAIYQSLTLSTSKISNSRKEESLQNVKF